MWGFWTRFPFFKVRGILSLVANIILAGFYFIVSLIVFMLVGMAVLLLVTLTAPCWFLLLL